MRIRDVTQMKAGKIIAAITICEKKITRLGGGHRDYSLIRPWIPSGVSSTRSIPTMASRMSAPEMCA